MEKTFEYSYTGEPQVFVVPRTGIYKIEVWGASGGIGYGNANPIGLGGYTSGEMILFQGESLYIYVGEDGKGTYTTKAFNGGGKSYSGTGHNGGRGGGATDIRRKNGSWDSLESLNSRIIVAGGGGGAMSSCGGNGATAGHGGGLTGMQSYNNGPNYRGSYANGGTQSQGGNAYSPYSNNAVSGTFGVGADANTCAAGGGGGYYGGGSVYTAGGGGGSGFLSPGMINTSIITGNSQMPSPTGTVETGHKGDGYCKITESYIYGIEDLNVKNNIILLNKNELFELTTYKNTVMQNNYKLKILNNTTSTVIIDKDIKDLTTPDYRISYKTNILDILSKIKEDNSFSISMYSNTKEILNDPLSIWHDGFKYIVCEKIVNIKPITFSTESTKVRVLCKYTGTDIKIGISPDNGETWSYGSLDEVIETKPTTSIKIKFFMTSDVELTSYSVYYGE